MVLKKFMGLLLVALVVCFAAVGWATVPDVTKCSATSNHAGFAVVMNVPDGTGSPLNEAFPILSAPGVVPVVFTDATITVVVNNASSAPIEDFPAIDIWLESLDSGLAPCVDGAIADGPTGPNGITQFQDALLAGGWSSANTVVMIGGDAVPGSIALGFNSPDLDGSGAVNLTDVQIFAGDFFGAYAFRSDLYYDSIVNLSDLPLLAAAIGASCSP
jgi:hypothetical protein